MTEGSRQSSAVAAARKWIFGAGVLYVASAVVQHAMSEYATALHLQVIWGTAVGLFAVHTALWMWARTEPYAAAIVGLILFATLQAASAVIDPGLLFAGLAFDIVIVVVLIRAIAAGRRAESMHSANRAGAPDGGGLLTSLGVYLACLTTAVILAFTTDGPIGPVRPFYAVLAAVAAAACGVWRQANLPALRAPRLSARALGTTAAGAVALVAIVAVVQYLLPDLWGSEARPYKLADRSLSYAFVDIAILPGIVEELVFRGVVLSALLGMFRPRTAIVVSALMFASIHVSPVALIHLTVLGAILGKLRVDTGSVWPCVIAHIGWNAAVLLKDW